MPRIRRTGSSRNSGTCVFDCHNGNGTEDIFLGNSSVLYVSLHQSPLYPGTGLEGGYSSKLPLCVYEFLNGLDHHHRIKKNMG